MKKIMTIVPMVALIALPLAANAHERQQFRINDEVYEFVIGSLNEPITVDDKTGLDLSVREVHEASGAAEEDHHTTAGAISGLEETLKVELIAGDMKKTMDISPVFNTPGAYKNTFYPTVATTFSYRIFGTIEDTPIDFTTSCTPAGHARAEEDKTEVRVNDQVTRILKVGGFGCPVAKEDLGFPEKSASVVDLATSNDSTKNWAMTGTGLGVLSLLLAGYAVMTRRRP